MQNPQWERQTSRSREWRRPSADSNVFQQRGVLQRWLAIAGSHQQELRHRTNFFVQDVASVGRTCIAESGAGFGLPEFVLTPWCQATSIEPSQNNAVGVPLIVGWRALASSQRQQTIARNSAMYAVLVCKQRVVSVTASNDISDGIISDTAS